MADRPQLGSRAKRVRRTGLAVVHEGEVVLPAAGSEAEAEAAGNDARTVVHYYFPVEIEVVGSAPQPHAEGLVRQLFGRFATALNDGE